MPESFHEAADVACLSREESEGGNIPPLVASAGIYLVTRDSLNGFLHAAAVSSKVQSGRG